MTPTKEQAKVRVYDLSAQMSQIQAEITELNHYIANYKEPTPESTDETKGE